MSKKADKGESITTIPICNVAERGRWIVILVKVEAVDEDVVCFWFIS